MVDKLSGVVRTQAPIQIKARKKKDVSNTEQLKTDTDSFTETVLNNINFSHIDSDQELRRKLIFETLKEAFGDEIVSSPKFKSLIDNIDEAFANNKKANELQTTLKSEKKQKF